MLSRLTPVTVNVTRYWPGTLYVFIGLGAEDELLDELSPKSQLYFKNAVPFAEVVLENDRAEFVHRFPKAIKSASGAGIKEAVNALELGGHTPLLVDDKVSITNPFSISVSLGMYTALRFVAAGVNVPGEEVALLVLQMPVLV